MKKNHKFQKSPTISAKGSLILKRIIKFKNKFIFFFKSQQILRIMHFVKKVKYLKKKYKKENRSKKRGNKDISSHNKFVVLWLV